MPATICRLQPYGEWFSTLAGIAGAAAESNVFPGYYSGVVDDVFPARKASFANP